jgi:hypothetical protein
MAPCSCLISLLLSLCPGWHSEVWALACLWLLPPAWPSPRPQPHFQGPGCAVTWTLVPALALGAFMAKAGRTGSMSHCLLVPLVKWKDMEFVVRGPCQWVPQV